MESERIPDQRSLEEAIRARVYLLPVPLGGYDDEGSARELCNLLVDLVREIVREMVPNGRPPQ